jgi:hypothetical protein
VKSPAPHKNKQKSTFAGGVSMPSKGEALLSSNHSLKGGREETQGLGKYPLTNEWIKTNVMHSYNGILFSLEERKLNFF